MLPYEKENRRFNKASDRFSEKLSRNVLLIVTHTDRDSAVNAASALYSNLSDHELFNLQGEVDWFDFYFKYRFNLIPVLMRNVSGEKAEFESFKTFFYKNLFSPAANFYGEMLNKDPFLLFPQFINSVIPSNDKVDYDNNKIIIEDSARTTVLISTFLKRNGFEKEVQTEFNKFINKQKKFIENETGATIDYTGVIVYASRYMERAKHETTLIGMLSFVLIFIIMLFAFRRLKCLFWGAFPIITGLLFGLSVSVMIYDKIHIISITMGMCLIGISIDYSFHYLSEYAFCNSKWDSYKGLKNVLPGITMGLLTTSMGYLTLLFIPFTGLKQISVFTIAGIVGAFLTVLILFPVVFKNKGDCGNSYRYFRPVIYSYFRLIDRKKIRYTVFSVLIMVIIFGLQKITIADNVKMFQMKTEDLDKLVSDVRELTGVEYASEFLLVNGKSKEKLLQNIEKTGEKLERIRQKGKISDYMTLSKFVPSIKTQKNNYDLIADKVLSNKKEIEKLLLETGFKPEIAESLFRDIEQSKANYITIDNWLKSPVSNEYEKLWVGEIDGSYFSAILLSGIETIQSLEQIANNNIYVKLINNNSRISSLLKNVRENLFRFVPVLYSIVFLILILRYGFKKGFKIFGLSVLNFMLTISLLSLFSIEINIMHILALILVLALGIDYSVFLAESVDNMAVTSISILLSALTTIFSFGLLALSMIPALNSIGITILTGISINLFLSPFAADRKKLLRILS